MKLNIFFVLVLLFESLHGLQIDQKENSSISEIQQGSYTNTDSGNEFSESLMKIGIKKIYSNKLVVQLEKLLTGTASGLCSKLMARFVEFEKSLQTLTSDNSHILSTNSNTLLQKINILWSSASITPGRTLNELNKILPQLVGDVKNTVSTLSGSIGQLTDVVNKAIDDLAFEIIGVLGVVENSGLLKIGLSKKIDFTRVYKAVQFLTNSISAISEAILSDSKLAKLVATKASVTVLTFILNLFLIIVQGIILCISTMLYTTFQSVPDTLNTGLLSLDGTIEGITGAINLVAKGLPNSLTIVLSNLVNVTALLNAAFAGICGIFVGVGISVGHITQNLSNSLSSVVAGILG